ncbi:MAG TPA: hypothetical protein VLD59_08285 [Steroidobacteraceae bacterium]|nr:hypothetical protein [Steroidobacteraceae bacterium]
MISFIILGEPASKANSRIHRPSPNVPGGVMVIKGKKALAFEESGVRQIPPSCRVRMEGDVKVTMRIWYASRRPDLAEDLLLDMLQDRTKLDKTSGKRVLLQAGVYRNDRQVAWKDIRRMGLDPKNPRVEIVVEPLQAQQVGVAA